MGRQSFGESAGWIEGAQGSGALGKIQTNPDQADPYYTLHAGYNKD